MRGCSSNFEMRKPPLRVVFWALIDSSDKKRIASRCWGISSTYCILRIHGSLYRLFRTASEKREVDFLNQSKHVTAAYNVPKAKQPLPLPWHTPSHTATGPALSSLVNLFSKLFWKILMLYPIIQARSQMLWGEPRVTRADKESVYALERLVVVP